MLPVPRSANFFHTALYIVFNSSRLSLNEIQIPNSLLMKFKSPKALKGCMHAALTLRRRLKLCES